MKTQVEVSTFTRPAKPRGHVPGRVLIRFDSRALAEAASVPPGSSSKARLERVPSSVSEPLAYLRTNAGMREVDPIFGSVSRAARQRPADRDGLAAVASVREVDEIGAGIAVLELPDSKIKPGLLKRISASPAVEIVEPLPARWLCASPDPKSNLQWGLSAIGYFHASPPSADKVLVGVIDTGIDVSHPDLPDPGIYRHAGFGSRDPVGHGTHVSGVIAALTNNGVGITGMCTCEIASWKVFPDDPNDPYLDSTAYLRALGEVAAEGVDVVNLSIGGTAHSAIEEGLFARAIAEGVTFVAAMGNEFEEGNETSYPAAYDDVISVGAINEARARAPFSNTGKHIDLSAPGTSILSTLPMTKSVQRPETAYGAWSGTSMATPHVTAAAALLIASKPGRSPAQVAARLRKSAAPVPDMGGVEWTEEHGSGLLDLRAALR